MQDQLVQYTRQPTKSKKQLIWGLVCLLGPTALIIIAILLYAIVNFIAASTATPVTTDITTDTGLFNDPSPVQMITNIILYVVGVVGTLAWLPGLIAGIILLATRKK